MRAILVTKAHIKRKQKLGSVVAQFGRAVGSDIRGLRFEFGHRQNLNTLQQHWKDKNEEWIGREWHKFKKKLAQAGFLARQSILQILNFESNFDPILNFWMNVPTLNIL